MQSIEKYMRLKIQSRQILAAAILTGSLLSLSAAVSYANVFARTLRPGMRGVDVLALQKFLNTDIETRIASAGAGSLGNETDYFGPATKTALIKFQEKYRGEVLAPFGLVSGTGILGIKTREKVNMLLNSSGLETAVQNSNQVKTAAPAQVAAINSMQNQLNLTINQADFGLPIRLEIPMIKVDAPIESLGLTPDGAMAAPKGGVNAAWFNLGPRPGEAGSAVISGHYGTWKNGDGSVFDNLNKLKIGDRISVKDEKGVVTNFLVREIRSYDPDAEASDIFSSNDGKSHLNLITCEGAWNGITKTYSKRLVVFTDKE